MVEDDRAVRHSLCFALEAQGYRVAAFARAQEAIDSARSRLADCFLIDYALPDRDGLAMLETLRRRGLTCPAIVIASNPSARCRAQARKAGAPLVEKPLMGETLHELIADLLATPPAL
ncbi:MAG: response regulator [Caulobacteraceae bacterium]